MDYRPRILDTELADALQSIGAVVIEGPKAVGKTETGRRAASSEIRMETAAARQAYAADPSLVLRGATPRLIDEWQVEPDLWNDVRHAVDDRGQPGQFILTGSAVPKDDATRHSGAGRYIRLRMRPMSLFESGHSTGDVSFAAILRGESVSAAAPDMTVQDLADRIVIGGWPVNLGRTARPSLRALSAYVTDICQVDVQRLDGVRRDPAGVQRLFRSLARNVGTSATIARLTADANGADGSLLPDTVRAYLDALERLLVVENVAAWAQRLRSRARLREAPVRHFTDPSLATAALSVDPTRLLGDIEWMGLLFESIVVRDLRAYASPLGGQIFHYRDSNDLEADAIVELPDGTWAAFEVKLGANPGVVDGAAANLLKLKATVATEPVALGVITGTGFSLTRPDGVLQIAIGALAP